MNSLRSIIFILIIFISASPAKSQWIPCQGIEGGSCQSIVVQDSFLFIDGPGGIFRRHINDPTWDTACLTGGFAKIRSTGSTLFTFGGNLMSSLYRSIDNGFTWEYMDFDYEFRNIENVDNVIFLDTYNNGLLRSTDEGENWTETDPSPADNEIDWIFSQPGILYCYLEYVDSVFVTFDYGDTWVSYALTGIGGNAGQPYLFDQNLWITKKNHFYILDYISGEWNIQNDSLPSTVWSSNFIESNGILYCFTNDGFYRFDQEDSVWENESEGLEKRFCWDACLLDSTIYMATSGGPFSKSGNDNWMPQYDDLFGLAISKVFHVGPRIYALSGGLIYYSEEIDNGFEIMESHDYCPPNQVIATDTSWYMGSSCGFSISTDSGQSWTTYNSGIEGRKVFNIAIAQNFFFAEVSQPSGRGLFRSRNDTINWEVLPNEFGNSGGCYDIDVVNNDLFIISGSNLGLYRSTDNGTSFEAIPEVGNEYSSLYVKNNKLFFLRDYHDVLYSTDNGESWQAWISGLDDASFTSIDITDSEETTIIGGYIGPWNPVCYIELFSPQYPEGLDIKDNLPEYAWNTIQYVMMYNGGIFACPSSGGLWYRDDLAVGVNENETSNPSPFSQISIYPNPANDIINIHFEKNNEISEYHVVDYSGKILIRGKIDQGLNHFSLNVSNLPNGIYLFVIRGEDKIISAKFIIGYSN